MIAKADHRLPMILLFRLAVCRSPILGGVGEGSHVRLDRMRRACTISGRAGARTRSSRSALVIFQLGRFDSRDDGRWDLLADQSDDRSDLLAILRHREHERPPEPAGAAGSADAVDIVLSVDRDIKAEDVTQTLDVQ